MKHHTHEEPRTDRLTHEAIDAYGGIYRGAGANPPSKQLTLTRIADALERIADQFEKGSDGLDVMKDKPCTNVQQSGMPQAYLGGPPLVR